MLSMTQIVEAAVSRAHSAGTQSLSHEQFDALFLNVRAMQALKLKHADDPLGIQCGLMQEDVLRLMGLPLNQQYLEEKAVLDKKHAEKMKDAKDSKKKHLQDTYLSKVEEIRLRYKIDDEIQKRIHDLKSHPQVYEHLRENFPTRLSMDFVEEDMDVKVKQQHESDAEFKLKQQINEKLKGDYRDLRIAYLADKQAIDDRYASQKAAIQEKIEAPIADKMQDFDEKIKKIAEKMDYLDKYFPAVLVKDNNLQMRATIQQELHKAKQQPNRYSAERIAALETEAWVLQHLAKNQGQYAVMSSEARKEGLLADLKDGLQAERSNLIQDQREILQAQKALFEPEMKALQADHQSRLKACEKRHKAELEVAKEYFDAEILPLVKELKTQEAQKYFIVLSKRIKEVVIDNVAELEQVDSNTIALIALMQEMSSDLMKMGAVSHLAMKTAKEAIQQNKDTKVKGNLQQHLLELAAKRVGKKIGQELKELLSHKEDLESHIRHMEQHARLRVPEELSEEFEANSLVDYLPTAPDGKEKKPAKDSKPESLFDIVDEIGQSKGLLQKAKAGVAIYKCLTAKNAEMALVDAPNPAQMFVSVLKDEALSFNFKLLEQMGLAIDALNAHHNLDHLDNKEDWVGLLKEINLLEKQKQRLDEAFQGLVSIHEQERQLYQTTQAKFERATAKLTQLTDRQQALRQQFIEKQQEVEAKKEKIYQKYLPESKRIEQQQALDDCDVRFQREQIRNDNWYQGEKRKLEQAYEEANQQVAEDINKHLAKFDQDTAEGEWDVIKTLYQQDPNTKSKFFLRNKDLQKYREATPSVELAIARYRDQRAERRTVMESQYQKAYEGELQKHEKRIGDLILKYGERKLSTQKDHYNRRDKILSTQKKAHDMVQSLYGDLNQLEQGLAEVTAEVEAQTAQVEAIEQDKIKISRAFYQRIQAFNDQKEEINLKAQDLLGEAFSLNAEQQPHLRALQSLNASAHKKISALAVAAANLPIPVDALSTMTMSYEDVVGQVMQRREVKAVMETPEEKKLADRLKDNAVNLGAKTIVEAVSGHAVKFTSHFVENLSGTLKAETEFREQQSKIDQRAEELGIGKPVEPEVVAVKVNPKKKGFLRNIMSAIGEFFSSIHRILKGTKQERKAEQAELEAFAKEEKRQEEAQRHSLLSDSGTVLAFKEDKKKRGTVEKAPEAEMANKQKAKKGSRRTLKGS